MEYTCAIPSTSPNTAQERFPGVARHCFYQPELKRLYAWIDLPTGERDVLRFNPESSKYARDLRGLKVPFQTEEDYLELDCSLLTTYETLLRKS